MIRNTPSDTQTDDAPRMASLTDPTRLSLRDDVEETTHRFDHDEDYCEAEYEGRAIVGVTNGAGETFLAVHAESGATMLPNGKVDPGSDWVATGEEAAADLTGVDCRIQDAVLLRHAEHYLEGDDEPVEVTTHVVFEASPVPGADATGDVDVDVDADGVVGGWYDELPPEADLEDKPVHDDVRRFVA